MTTGVIYARVSSIGDRQSTERQVKDLSGYAKYKGIEIRKVFEEHISGAKKNDERPVLCEAMEYCKANRIGILLVSELSRLGRNAFEVLASVKELIDCGINLYIQKEQLTLLDEEGHPSLFAPIMIATLSTCAQLERDNISLLHIKRNMTYYRTLAVFLHQIFCTKYHTVVIGHCILLFYFLL